MAIFFHSVPISYLNDWLLSFLHSLKFKVLQLWLCAVSLKPFLYQSWVKFYLQYYIFFTLPTWSSRGLGFNTLRQLRLLGCHFVCQHVLSYVVKSHPSEYQEINLTQVFSDPKDFRCFWCPLIFNCLSNCHPSLLSLLDCLYMISFSFFSPSFFLPSHICYSHFYYISSVVFPVFLSSLSLWHYFLPLLCHFCFPSSSFSSCHVSFISHPLTNVSSTSCSAPVILPLLNPRTSSAANPFPPDVARYCGCEERCSDSEMCQSAES